MFIIWMPADEKREKECNKVKLSKNRFAALAERDDEHDARETQFSWRDAIF